jgi:hypothetical protein
MLIVLWQVQYSIRDFSFQGLFLTLVVNRRKEVALMAGTPTTRPYWTPDTPVVRLTEQERTKYAEQIREMVTRWSLTFTWLICRLSDEGLMTDKFEMSATLSGVRTGSKADEILRRSLDILREYQERMGLCKEP